MSTVADIGDADLRLLVVGTERGRMTDLDETR